jgi:predicted O-methyltransferase YrrM
MLSGWLRSPRPVRAPVQPRAELVAQAMSTKGFLAIEEGLALFELAAEASRSGPCLEVGSYCGKSALFLGEGCRVAGVHPLFTVDHHRGSEEQQPGQEYHDPELYDVERAQFTTLRELTFNLARAGLAEWVIPIVGSSLLVGRYFGGRELGLVFIDGSHSEESVTNDYETWGPRVRRGGFLCFHDLFSDPNAGGQAPYRVFERARASRDWRWHGQTGSLGVLTRAR